jgi:hypothetical protein
VIEKMQEIDNASNEIQWHRLLIAWWDIRFELIVLIYFSSLHIFICVDVTCYCHLFILFHISWANFIFIGICIVTCSCFLKIQVFHSVKEKKQYYSQRGSTIRTKSFWSFP